MDNVVDDLKVNQVIDTMKVARFPLDTYEIYIDKGSNSTWKARSIPPPGKTMTESNVTSSKLS